MRCSLPKVDFSAFMVEEGVIIGEPPTKGQKLVAETIDRACRTHGFLGLTNFGMSTSLLLETFSASKELFEMEGKEEKLARIRPETNMGYAPFRSEGINRARPSDLKEAFNVRFPPSHSNNLDGTPKTFPDLVDKLLDFYKDLTLRYARACAVALDLPHTFFVDSLDSLDLCTIRMLHYPPCDWEECGDENDVSNAIRIGEHTDFGAFTFLLIHPDHGPDGLQIKPVEGGEVSTGEEESGWKDVVMEGDGNASEHILIVNTGALMARWTNDEWKATAHRVVVPDAASAARHRYSTACFVDPDSNYLVDVHERFYGGSVAKKYDPITGSGFLMEKLRSMMPK